MATEELEAAAAPWAEALGCDLRLLGEPGGHVVQGGVRLRDLNGVYIAAVRASVFVYCPRWLQPHAAAVLASTPPGQLFTPARAPGSPASDERRYSVPRGTGSPTLPTSRLLSAAAGADWTARIRC